MREHATMTTLLHRASDTARKRGGQLRRLRIRLGALAAEPSHLRADFESVRAELGMGGVELELEVEPDRPSGVELLLIEVGVG